MLCRTLALAGILTAAGLLFSAQVARRGPSVWIGVGFNVEKSGLRVATLPYDSPAEKAGFMLNDLIVGVDGAGMGRNLRLKPEVCNWRFRNFIQSNRTA